MNLPDLFSGNQFLSGGAILAAAGVAFAFVRRYATFGFAKLRARYIAEVEVREPEMVRWLGAWLAETPYGKKCRRLMMTVLFGGESARGHGTASVGSSYGPSKRPEPELVFEPGLGPHLFRHGGHWVICDRRREAAGQGNNLQYDKEWFVLRVIGPRAALERLLEDVKIKAGQRDRNRQPAFISDGGGGWEQVATGNPRELASVVLPGSTVDDVVGRCTEFLSSQRWYVERAIPWRLGFGLFGAPGTGKTSLARAVAHHLDLPLYVLDLTSGMRDRELVIALSRLPPGAVLLAEDLDAQMAYRPGDDRGFVSLSGLLNALDGPLATDGRILFVTSNTPERLDAALLRAGRVDVEIHFGYATRGQAAGLWARFFPELAARAGEFAAHLPDGTLPPAMIQEHLITHARDPEAAMLYAFALANREVRVVERRGAA